jgi:glycosyltransferase involved in cell wall biosynthesis
MSDMEEGNEKGTMSEDTHLVLFSEDFYPNTSGGGHTRWLFAKKAVEQGVTVTTFTTRDPGTKREETVEGVKIVRPIPGAPSSTPAYSNLSIPFRILSAFVILLYGVWWFHKNDIDAIHSASHSFHWVGRLLSILYDVPLTNFVGYTPSLSENSMSIRNKLESLNFRFFMGETVYCRTNDVQEFIQSAGNKDVRVLHGILHSKILHSIGESKSIRSSYEIPEDTILITFVGRLVPIKRPLRLVETMIELPEKYHLLVVGDGPEKKQIKHKVQQKNINSQVTLAGEVPHTEALKIIKSSDILQLTSRNESYGAVVFEALSLGSHVVATPVGVLTAIEHEELYVAPTEQHADIIAGLKRGSHSLQENIVEQYSMERYTQDVLERTQELVDSNRK